MSPLCIHSILIQPFLPPEVSERSDVRQREGEAEEIFVAHVGDGVAAIFEGHAAAIPVIGGLCGGELKLFDFRVKAKAAGGAEPGTGESAIAEGDTELLE